MAQHAPRHHARYRDYDDDPPRRRYADEDVGPRRRQPEQRKPNVIATLVNIGLLILIVLGIIAYLPYVLAFLKPAIAPATTTTALPTANMTPWPTQPATQPGAIIVVATPTRAPTDAPACVPVAGGVDLHVGSDGATIGVGNGQACPEQQDMAVENAPVPDYGANRDTTGAWVGPTDAPVPTLAPTQAAAFAAQFKPATPNNAFVGYLPGRAPPTPWPTAEGPRPGDADFASSFH